MIVRRVTSFVTDEIVDNMYRYSFIITINEDGYIQVSKNKLFSCGAGCEIVLLPHVLKMLEDEFANHFPMKHESIVDAYRLNGDIAPDIYAAAVRAALRVRKIYGKKETLEEKN